MRKKSTVTWEVIYYQPTKNGGRWKRCHPVYAEHARALTFYDWLENSGYTALIMTTHQLDIVGLPDVAFEAKSSPI